MTNFNTMRHIEIDAAHRVPDHLSKCRNLHGHRYKVEAHVAGALAVEGSQTGMTLDFSFIKEALIQKVHDPCDHGLILKYDDPMLKLLLADFVVSEFLGEKDVRWCQEVEHPISKGLKLYLMADTPTAENLACHWYHRMKDMIRDRSESRAWLGRIRVHETPNCWAEYPAGG